MRADPGQLPRISRDIRSAVAQECERFVLDHIERSVSFAVETTLRTTASIEQAQLARQRGFSTHLRFVATDWVAENVSRVLQRAQSGGHGASERDIRGIYAASCANLPRALRVFKRVRVYDTTERWAPPRLVATTLDGQLDRIGPSPTWLERAPTAESP